MIELIEYNLTKICDELGYGKVLTGKSFNRIMNDENSQIVRYIKKKKHIIIYLELVKNNLKDKFLNRADIIEEIKLSKDSYYSIKYTIKEDDIEFMISLIKELHNEKMNFRKIVLKKNQARDIIGTRTVSERALVNFNRKLKFGIELELTVPSVSDLKERLKNKGIRVSDPNSTHEVVSGWKLVYDGSIKAKVGYQGIELVSPPSTDFNDLKIICDVLKEVGAKVNSSCGLHVHHDINDLKRQQIMRIYNFYNKYEKIINLMMPKHRINNRFCKPVSDIIHRVNICDTKEELLQRVAGKGSRMYYNSCRYYAINLRSFLYYGTIEFRQGFSTIDFDTITSWIIFTHKIIERALQIGNDIDYNLDNNIQKSFDEMIKESDLEDTDVMDNLRKRFNKYRGREI